MEDETRAALLLGVVTAASEVLARQLLELLTVTVRERLGARAKARKAKHLAPRQR